MCEQRTREPGFRFQLWTAAWTDPRRQAVIQLASMLRTLGHPETSANISLLERGKASDHRDDAEFVDLGRERETATLALGTLDVQNDEDPARSS